ncbi:MAG TPA: P-loop NTPase fold protein [Pyrinomonadaceae bacterium]|jgi:hypothetical protein
MELAQAKEEQEKLDKAASHLSSQPAQAKRPKLSPSVEYLSLKLVDLDVDAWSIVRDLLSNHDYVQGLRDKLSLSTGPGAGKKPIKAWLDDIITLYDPEKLPELHGRMVIMGLALLVPDLYKQLSSNGFLAALEAEIKESLWDILSTRGIQLYVNDAVTSHTDHPAKIDLLGRKAFADALAIRLRRIATELRKTDPPQSFMLNINGPWGAGKSSLLNFLSEALKDDMKSGKVDYPGWVVVNFNAWKHQRIGLPWWSLLDSVFRQSVSELRKRGLRLRWRAFTIWIREQFWRLKAGRTHYFLAVTIIFGVLALLFYLKVVSFPGLFTADEQRKLESASKLITLAGAFFTAAIALTRSLVSGSARAARDFINTGHDPMSEMTNHFVRLVDSIKQPVAIFIDDLDRCNGNYVVDLIEGIQTLCRDTAVTFIVAADRRWICSSYAKAYDSFASYVDEPGRPLGYLFLDKIFQLSTSIPRMSVDIQSEYWKRLLSGSETNIEKRLREAEEEAAHARTGGSDTEQSIIDYTRKRKGDDPYQVQARRGAAVLQLASQEVEAEIEHALKDFASLLEPNPRAMKRLINAYAVQRAIATLAGVSIRREQLALWTITSLRWPLLTEFLEEQPEMIEFLETDEPLTETELAKNGVPRSLRKLFRDNEVLDVFKGEGIGEKLDKDAIVTCASLRAAGMGSSSVVA